MLSGLSCNKGYCTSKDGLYVAEDGHVAEVSARTLLEKNVRSKSLRPDIIHKLWQKFTCLLSLNQFR